MPGLESEIVSASILRGTGSSDITYKDENGWIVFNLPYKSADTPVSVIEVKLVDEAQSAKIDTGLGIYPNIKTVLLSDFAAVSNAERKDIKWMEKFGEWKHVNQISNWEENGQAEWIVDVFLPGYYQIDLKYKGENRLVWRITTDEGEIVQNQQAATEKYQTYPMGVLEFKTADKHTISVSLVEGNQEKSSLKAVSITPIN